AQDVAVGPGGQGDDDLFPCFNGHAVDEVGYWRLSFRVDEFDGHHGATAPDVTDTRIVLLYLFEVLSDDLADAGRFFGQVFFFHDVNCGKRCGDCHRVPAVGPAETTRMHSVHDLGATGHRRQWHTTGDALGQCDEVGFDPFGFRGEPGAGADETCLNLIGDE